MLQHQVAEDITNDIAELVADAQYHKFPILAGIPVEGKSSECLICMKY